MAGWRGCPFDNVGDDDDVEHGGKANPTRVFFVGFFVVCEKGWELDSQYGWWYDDTCWVEPDLFSSF